MKKIYFIVLAIFGMLITSCQTNEITFPFEELNTDQFSEIRLINAIPVTGSSDSLVINGNRYSSVATSLGSYYPASAAKYFALPVGDNSVSLRFLAKTSTPTVDAFTYSANIKTTKGKWSAYIYDKTKSPVLLQDAESVPTTDAWKDTVCFIRFVNFFHKSDGVTPFGKITLKAKKNLTGAAWETIATDIDFGTQSSEYFIYKLKNVTNLNPWSGAEASVTIGFFDSAGNQYQQFSSATASTKSAYSSTGWSFAKGRAYVIYINGKEGSTNNKDQFIRLGSFLTK